MSRFKFWPKTLSIDPLLDRGEAINERLQVTSKSTKASQAVPWRARRQSEPVASQFDSKHADEAAERNDSFLRDVVLQREDPVEGTAR